MLTDIPSLRLAGVKHQKIIGTRKRPPGHKLCSCEMLAVLNFTIYITDYSLNRAAYGLPKNRDLAITKDHFMSIMDNCAFPKELFFQAMCEKAGHFAHFIDFIDDESPDWICKLPIHHPTYTILIIWCSRYYSNTLFRSKLLFHAPHAD